LGEAVRPTRRRNKRRSLILKELADGQSLFADLHGSKQHPEDNDDVVFN
jgi:hypothetical protein